MYRAPRGTSDILPAEQQYWRYIEERAAQICHLNGYERIDTPVFENAGLFVRTIGEGTDIVEKETYSFPDRGGVTMTLRPEGTAPVCRAYIEHGMYNLPQPIRLYYIAPIFRYERPQAGRYRQHQQFGFEAIGDGDPAIDAEVIDMGWRLFLTLGIGRLTLRLNSIGCRGCRPGYIEALKGYYQTQTSNLCRECKARLVRNPLRLLDCKEEGCRDIARSAPRSIDYLCQGCQEHFELLKRYLGLLKLPFEIDHCLVRGLDYYTRTVFEVQPEGEEGAQSVIGGGGRYDDLIGELGGRPTPAVGFAAGIERIILNMKRQGIPAPSNPKPSIFICYLGDEASEEAIRLVAEIRGSGTAATIASGSKSLKAQLRQANSLGMSIAVIIGEEEVKGGVVIIRDMIEGEQRNVPMDEAVGEIKGILKSRLPLV